MSDPPAPVQSTEELQTGPSPHSKRYIALRVLGALMIAGIALAVQRLVLADEASRNTFGAKVRTKEIDSSLLDRTLPVKVVVPKGAPANDRGLVVFLHGRGEDESSYLIEPMFEALDGRRTRAPVIAFPDGGDSSYWHDRESGEWASYVLDELIPELVVRFDVDPDKIAIGGISMGGFGAYDIARLEPDRFCAVAGHSPVIWESSGETADGAFDDAGDFDRNNIIEIAGSAADPYSALRLWLDAGIEDPFLDGDQAFEDALRSAGATPVVKSFAGGHDNEYWNDNWEEYLGWYANSLRQCGREAAEELKRRERLEAQSPGKGAGSSGNQSPSKPAAPADAARGD